MQLHRGAGRLRPEEAGLVERVGRWAREKPEHLAFSFLDRGETPAAQLSFAGLHERALLIGGLLRDAGCTGEAVILTYPPGLGFIEAFLGCLYAAAIAVPAPYPLQEQGLLRLAAIARASGARTVLTTATSCQDEAFAAAFTDSPVTRLLSTDRLAASTSALPAPLRRVQGQPAFLQFTSGSTGVPKGVIVTHEGLEANQRMIEESFAHDSNTRVVSWLPMHHDMGLVGCVLQPLWLGIESHVMSPLAFLQKPVRWLSAISRYKATTSGAPNFSFELAAKMIRPEQCIDLDLSSWRVAFCGAEPVRAQTLSRFAARFAPHGFQPSALFPCYGMAEATLFISGGPAGSGMAVTDDATPRVKCGRSWGASAIVIADPGD